MSFTSILSKIAPELEAGLTMTGPFGGLAAMAIKAVSDVVDPGNANPTLDSVQTALAGATPEQMLELQKVNNDFKTKMAELNLDVLKLQAEQEEALAKDDTDDRGSARQAFGILRFLPQIIITSLTSLGLAGIIIAMATHALQPDPSQAVLFGTLVTGLLTAWLQQMNFWFGSTHGSQKKDDTLAQAALAP